MADAFPLSGGIDPKAFPFVIAHLHRQGATGSLKVDGPSYQKAVYFRGGRILFGSSNDPKDQLGAILIETGRIAPEQLEEVNAKVGPGNPLAKVLAESGFVNQRELSEAARTKVERILADIIFYDSGSFEFEDGVLPKGAVDLKLVTERLIVAAVRRIQDRSFVLRHIDGLDVVLVQTADAGSKIAELDADTTVLPQRFDGRRNIKDAAAEARLDEFDAAKISCALLFLGFVEKARPQALEETQGDQPALFTPGDLGAELDLGEEARLAVDGLRQDSPETDVTMLITEPPDFDTSPPTPLDLSPMPEPEPERPAEPPIPPPPPRRTTPVPIPEPQPEPESEPSTIIIPGPGEGPETTGAYATQPDEETPDPRTPVPSPANAPPSKEDLAALDALLNARHVEGPLAPFDKGAPRSNDPRWEPRFDGGGRRVHRAQAGRGKLFGAIAVLVLAAGAAAWFLLIAPRLEGPGTTAPAPTSVAAAPTTTLAVPGTTLAAPLPSAPPELSAPATTPPATTLPAAPPPPPPTTVPPRVEKAGSLADARAAFRRGAFGEAARGFTASLRSARDTYTVQLLVACSDETVSKAVEAVSAPDLFIVPVTYKGRSCYRMCWGLYDSEPRARAGIGSVPEYFRKGGASPKAVTAASVLP
jgi:hypothetical protein